MDLHVNADRSGLLMDRGRRSVLPFGAAGSSGGLVPLSQHLERVDAVLSAQTP
jgi:hypothetical protein